MKKILIVLLVLILVSSLGFGQSIGSPKYLKPINHQEKIIIKIFEKARTYYLLDANKSSVINLKGPGILRIMTRAAIHPYMEKKIKYDIKYVVNGGRDEYSQMTSVDRSSNANFVNENMGIPSQLEDFEIELGRGYHTIEFLIVKSLLEVAAKYKFTPHKPKKLDWITYSSLQPSEPVELISREEVIKYYRFSGENTIKVEVNGPTEIRMLTRMENHYDMKGRIQYRLQVKENGKVVNTYQLSSRRSEIATYKNNKNLVPGKACEFVIVVPKGRHVYEIVPLDKDKSTILGRFLIPEKDVKLIK